MRIVSLLPSATEMVYALGLGDQLVGVTHECDYPRAALSLPKVVKAALDLADMTQAQIDAAVTARLREGKTLYEVDEQLLDQLAPDLILTQDLCQVCAPSGNELSRAVLTLRKKPQLIWMTPRDLKGVQDNIRVLAEATNAKLAATQLLSDWDVRIAKVKAASQKLTQRPRTFCFEWIDPVFCAGHWIPEMVRLAGGDENLGREGGESVRIPWSDVLAHQPDMILIMSCGYPMHTALEQAQLIRKLDGIADLPAARNDKIYVLDSNALYARPGPRLVDGTELLSHLITGASWTGDTNHFAKFTV